MQDTIQVTPTLIRRVLPGKIEIADVPSAVAEGRALLVFLNEEQAEFSEVRHTKQRPSYSKDSPFE